MHFLFQVVFEIKHQAFIKSFHMLIAMLAILGAHKKLNLMQQEHRRSYPRGLTNFLIYMKKKDTH